MDPLSARLVQPDQRSCGPSCLVMARMLRDPAYADQVLAAGSWRNEVLAVHRRATAPVDAGRVHPPWPRALGTPPWAVARLMRGWAGRPGARYRSRLIVNRRETAYVAISRAVGRGHLVPVFLGSRWLPRHVVLAVRRDPSGVWVYDPASGRVVPLPRDAFAAGRLSIAGWSRAWFAVLPGGREALRNWS
jgi:hypothetical protein